MSKPIHIIYISGFGSKYDALRSWCIARWKYKNVTAELVPMNWSEGTFEQKLSAINNAIDRVSGKHIVLVGESAGGSMAVHMLAKRPNDLYRVMTICGKNSHPETVGRDYREKSPAFATSMNRLNRSIAIIPQSKMHQFVSLHPIYDPLVPVTDTLLPGCRSVRLPLIGHTFVIFMVLSLLSPIVVHTARQ